MEFLFVCGILSTVLCPLLAIGLFLGLEGIKYWIKFIYIYLKICHHKSKTPKRLSKEYDIKKPDATVLDLGILPRALEYELENPQKILKEGFSDGVHVFGVDENQNTVDIIVKSIGYNQATLWVVLKIAGDDTYELPNLPDTRYACIENSQYFSAGGLQIQCCSPLRQWRISFNGELKKCLSEDEDDLVHVKFSFVWLGMSLVHDIKTDYSPSEAAKAFLSAGLEKTDSENLLKFENVNDRYEQWGQMMGTIKIGPDSEKEFYLWSARSRLLDKETSADDIKFLRMYFYFKNGLALKIETTSVKGLMKNFIDAYAISPGFTKTNLTDCDFEIEDFIRGTFSTQSAISFKNRGRLCRLLLSEIAEPIKVRTGKQLEKTITMTSVKVHMNDEDGYGIIYSGIRSKILDSKPYHMPPIILRDKVGSVLTEEHLVISLDHEDCQNSLIAGGKGSSLALLSKLAKATKYFSVSEGFVITTTAFESHIKQHDNLKAVLENLRMVSCGRKDGDLKEECERCCKEFSSTGLTQFLKSTIEDQIKHQFGSCENITFAVRSSAYGEDSQELSCAGLMSTFLGMRGLNAVFTAIANCWSSHYRFEAVQYLRQNGQPVDAPMAVILQKMIASDVAGVMFTVDPVSGNTAYPCITANFGLGETVVSASVEPDTFILKKDQYGLLSLFEQKLGNKNAQELLKIDGGTERKYISPEKNQFCLTKDWALKIGDIGMVVAKCFCGPRDIEWALVEKTLFILQARPVTTLHRESDFEIIHDQDTPIQSSYEYSTRANTGEVFIESSSPLCLSLVITTMDINSQKNFINHQRDPNFSFVPYLCHWLPVTHRQVTLSLTNTIFRANGKTISSTQKAFEVALLGRVIDADDMHKCGVKKFGYMTTRQKINGLRRMLSIFLLPINLEGISKKVTNLNIPVESFTTSAQIFQSICCQLQLYFEVSTFHGLTTFLSSFYNNIILTTLAQNGKAWDNSLYADFANLFSSCQDVESAEIPLLLKNIAKSISEEDGITFSSVPVEVAFSLLKNDKGQAGKLFGSFLKNHGHRCVKEFDVHSQSWRMQPENIIKTLQNLVMSSEIINTPRRETTSVDSAINNLKTPLTGFRRFILKKVLPRSRIAVGKREQSKSLLIKVIDWLRKSCYHMADLLIKDGHIPDKDLFFFFTMVEIKNLIETKHPMPSMIQKAMRRRQMYVYLNNLIFPEIMAGIPKPIKDMDNEEIQSGAHELSGTLVCSGTVKARARVILNLEEASSIKTGEILVTHATDVGWTPYFTLLSGVITELGGLISHGAVVAREYGLPCIVGVQNATTLIKSGDLILLDGTNGTITKIEELTPVSKSST